MAQPEASDSDSALGRQVCGVWLEWIGFALGAMVPGLWHAYDLLWLRNWVPPGLTRSSAFFLTATALVVHALGGAVVFAAIARLLRKGHRLRPGCSLFRMLLAVLAGLFFANGFTVGVGAGIPFIQGVGVYLAYIVFGPLVPSILFVSITRGRLLQTGPICPQCGYLLYYARDYRCPECGRAFLLGEIDTSNAQVGADGLLYPRSTNVERR